MKPIFKIPALAKMLTLCSIIGCGTWIGNPPDKEGESGPAKAKEDNVDLVFKSPESATFDIKNRAGTVLGQITLTENKHVIRDLFVFEANKQEKPLFEGPFVVNLLNGEVTPKPTAEYLAAGTYTKAAFTTTPLQSGDIAGIAADDPLIGNTSIMKGIIVAGGLRFPFDLSFPWSAELNIRNAIGAEPSDGVSDGSSHDIVVNIDYSKWFEVENIADLFSKDRLLDLVKTNLETKTSFSIEKQ